VIICSCNVLSEEQILAALKRSARVKSRTPGDAYRCLGCAPRCGRCMQSVRALLAKTDLDIKVGCATCPSGLGRRPASAGDEPQDVPLLIAAE
jgi:bacterioferritin-associated ferredoxin